MSRCICSNCQGEGQLPCPACRGPKYHGDIFDQMFGRECDECDGSRTVDCLLCNGSGAIFAYKGE